MDPVRVSFSADASLTAIADMAFYGVTILAGALVVSALIRLLGTMLERQANDEIPCHELHIYKEPDEAAP